jgi:hypothetical protein
MAQVITRCRLTGHYMFMGMDVDPKEFTHSPGPFTRKFCPFCACDHLWHREDSKFLAPKACRGPIFNKRADRYRARRSQRRSGSQGEGIAFATSIHR